MHVGCCENCRYIDLIENLPNGCPRCGGRMVSLGIDSVRWNRMNAEGKKSLLIRMLTEPKLRPVSTPESESELEEKAEITAELVKQAETRDEQVRQAEAIVEKAREAEAIVEKAKQADLEAAIRDQKLNQKYVFICCKCYSIEEHNRCEDSYFCPECGSRMEDSGYRTTQWVMFSKEEKRKITDEIQLRHIIHAIRMSSDEDIESKDMQNVIDVVGDDI